jgi:hypothetical protein
MSKAGAADAHGVRVLAGPAVFLGELGEDQRRRVLLNPTPKLLEA